MHYDGLIGTAGVLRRRFAEIARKEGIGKTVMAMFRLVILVLLYPWFRFIRRGSFQLGGERYSYFHHWYNTTYDNERCVEIALGVDAIKRRPGARVLEVGNVLSHYGISGHAILDKYEKGTGVINEDIVHFHPREPYDLIVCISTMEHVGFDEVPQDPAKIPRAILHLASLLKPGGRLLVTMPVAYNPNLDRMLRERDLFPVQRYMRRIAHGRWEETTKEQALTAQFNTPYSFANALVIGIVDAA